LGGGSCGTIVRSRAERSGGFLEGEALNRLFETKKKGGKPAVAINSEI